MDHLRHVPEYNKHDVFSGWLLREPKRRQETQNTSPGQPRAA